MSDIKLVRSHALPLAEAKAVVQQAADDLAAEYDLKSDWRGDTLHFHRSGVDGSMRVTGDEIDLDIKLGLLLKPFKAKLVAHIERTFDKLLAKNAAKKEKTAARKTTRR